MDVGTPRQRQSQNPDAVDVIEVVPRKKFKRKNKKFHNLSRNSGLKVGIRPTFGGAPRFGMKYGNPLQTPGATNSPYGKNFFGSNAANFAMNDRGPMASLGKGERTKWESFINTPDFVGPGCYSPITSFSKVASPLDGPEFCKSTMKSRTKAVGSVDPGMVPGPGAYTAYKPLGHDAPKASLKGPYPPLVVDLGLKKPANLQEEEFDKVLRKTFSTAKRFVAGLAGTQSANGDQYYSHQAVWNANDYCKMSKSCSLGKGQRQDFAAGTNKLVAPWSYNPLTSAAKKTSPLDEFRLWMYDEDF